MQVHAVGVALPDLDQGVLDRVALRVQDLAREVRDLADAGVMPSLMIEQVVVGVERQLVRVERPFGLVGGAGEFLGERPADGPERQDALVAAEARNSRRLGR